MGGTLLKLIWKSNPAIYAPPKYKKACHYEALLPEKLADLRFSLEASIGGLVSEAEMAVRQLNDVGGSALDPLARLLLRTESVASSKVEGMQLGVRELAYAEARQETGGKTSQTATDVLANIDAMVLAIEESVRLSAFSIEQIQSIHKRLMERSENKKIAGVIRSEQNWIGGNDYNPCGADFVPPPPEHVHDLLSDLCDAINDDTLPPLVQAALVHAQFETIHPFADGNGRTGRALIHVVLRRRGLSPRYVPPISVAIATSRQRYIEGLTNFRSGQVHKWVEYFVGTSARAAKLATEYIRAVDSLRSKWHNQVAKLPNVPRADATIWQVLEILPAHPLITVAVASAALGRSKPSTYQAFEQLENLGILIPMKAWSRNRSWESQGLLELIDGFERGTPIN